MPPSREPLAPVGALPTLAGLLSGSGGEGWTLAKDHFISGRGVEVCRLASACLRLLVRGGASESAQLLAWESPAFVPARYFLARALARLCASALGMPRNEAG